MVDSSLLVLGLGLVAFAGLIASTLGAGGSILMVPILAYVLQMPPHEAIATSLLVASCVSVVALLPHQRRAHVHWRMGVFFGVTSMLAATAAGYASHGFRGEALLLLLGLAMLGTAIAMHARREAVKAASIRPPPPLAPSRLAAEGLVVGTLTGLVGAGGGFLIVPALVLRGGLQMRAAIATSLFVILLNASAGLVGHLGGVHFDPRLTLLIVSSAIAGSVAGNLLVDRAKAPLLRKGFVWLIASMAVFVLGQELPRALGHPILLARDWPWILGVTATIVAAAGVDLAREARRGTCSFVSSSTPSHPPTPTS